MTNLRAGETGQVPMRKERFYERDQYWYFTTREGADIGPYDTLPAAVQGCSEFINFVRTSGPDFSDTLRLYSAPPKDRAN